MNCQKNRYNSNEKCKIFPVFQNKSRKSVKNSKKVLTNVEGYDNINTSINNESLFI